MARIAALHNTLDLRSGADAVCLHVCEALDADHDVTLFTLSTPRLEELNELFDTDADVPVRTPPAGRLLGSAFATAADAVGPQLALRSVLLQRFFGRHAGEYDAAVSTANEFVLALPSVQYVHSPQFNARASGREAENGENADAGRLNGLWSRAAGVSDRRLPGDARLLANSALTADAVAGRYGRRPEVVHPPVDPIEGRPWDEREAGVVVVGRIAPDKRQLRAIDVVDRVHARGHDLHLHLVGSTATAYRSYVRRVRRAARDRAYVSFEGEVDRARLERLLGTHRYGLNVRPGETFGMAVAEYVAAGMLAFAPDAGAQPEVLGDDPDRLFEPGDPADATARLADAVADGTRPSLARDRFARDRFHGAVRDHVAAVLPSK